MPPLKEVVMIKVVATEPGFFGCYRNEGDEFEIEKESQKGKWMKRADDKPWSDGEVPKAKETKDGRPDKRYKNIETPETIRDIKR